MASWVWSQVRSCGICGEQSGQGVVGSEYYSFFRQFSFHWLINTHHHHLFPGAGTVGQIVTDVVSELSLTSSQEVKEWIFLFYFVIYQTAKHNFSHCLHLPNVLPCGLLMWLTHWNYWFIKIMYTNLVSPSQRICLLQRLVRSWCLEK
jgi:hypothetical protein